MSYSFISAKEERIQIDKLSSQYCQEHSDELLKLVNIIPFIHWGCKELLSQEEDYYGNKWNYSYVIKNSNNVIIGVLIAYFRIADSKHIFDSLYLHKFAILPEYQNMGIGTEALKYFIKKTFVEIPWLLNISVQTNDNSGNEHVIRFYENNGFKAMYNIQYPNKTDVLLLLERKFYESSPVVHIDKDTINLEHPRLNVTVEKYKKKMYYPLFILHQQMRKKER